MLVGIFGGGDDEAIKKMRQRLAKERAAKEKRQRKEAMKAFKAGQKAEKERREKAAKLRRRQQGK